MSENDLSFSKQVITRFSHDLAGAVSAVSNSIVLLSEVGGGDEEILRLANSNADILLARLRFFRAAFGNEGPLTDAGMTRRIVESYLTSLENKVSSFVCDWQVDDELPLACFRPILLGAQIVAEKLLRGGKITIHAKAGGKKISFIAEGQSITTDHLLFEILEGKKEEATPKTVVAVFLEQVLKELNWQISWSVNQNKIEMLLTA